MYVKDSSLRSGQEKPDVSSIGYQIEVFRKLSGYHVKVTQSILLAVKPVCFVCGFIKMNCVFFEQNYATLFKNNIR